LDYEALDNDMWSSHAECSNALQQRSTQCSSISMLIADFWADQSQNHPLGRVKLEDPSKKRSETLGKSTMIFLSDRRRYYTHIL
jgi:hypothetical protein